MTIRFGEFEFDERTGELHRIDGEDGDGTRLPPQPARLLALLVEHRPKVVGTDEIREVLWPDVQVEFEQSLHSCVRQVRAALGDSASEPRYVETIPRRGYRFLAEVQGDATSDADGERGSARRLGDGVSVGAALVALVVLVAALALRGGDAPETLRIGVMPFEPIAESSPLAARNDIAESIVARLAVRSSPRLEVVGPTTTQAYDGTAERLRALIDEFDLDYVVNGREIFPEEGPRILVELIRATDGAHVWVRYLDDLPGDAPLAETIDQEVVRIAATRE